MGCVDDENKIVYVGRFRGFRRKNYSIQILCCDETMKKQNERAEPKIRSGIYMCVNNMLKCKKRRSRREKTRLECKKIRRLKRVKQENTTQSSILVMVMAQDTRLGETLRRLVL